MNIDNFVVYKSLICREQMSHLWINTMRFSNTNVADMYLLLNGCIEDCLYRYNPDGEPKDDRKPD